jgi:hypothetical protein
MNKPVVCMAVSICLMMAVVAITPQADPVCADLDGDGTAETCGPDPNAPGPSPSPDPQPSPVCPEGQQPVLSGSAYECQDICTSPEIYEGGQCVKPKPDCSDTQYEEDGVCKDKPTVDGEPVIEP